MAKYEPFEISVVNTGATHNVAEFTAHSPDGRILVKVGSVEIQIWQTENGEQLLVEASNGYLGPGNHGAFRVSMDGAEF